MEQGTFRLGLLFRKKHVVVLQEMPKTQNLENSEKL